MCEEELSVVLKRSDHSGFGFSLLGKPGLPPIIFNIIEDSPAAESGEVEVGDVLLKVNETDVNRFSTKEVLKCLRLSPDPVTLKIKRDPKIKATVRKHLSVTSGGDADTRSRTPLINSFSPPLETKIVARPLPAVHQTSHLRTNGSCPEEEPLLSVHNDRLQWEPLSAIQKVQGKPKFEAYMMTGDKMLNISKPQQIVGGGPKQQKKVDNLRYLNSHTHHLRHQPLSNPQYPNSLPNSPNEMDIGVKNNHSKSGTTSPTLSANNRWENDEITTPQQDAATSKTYANVNASFVRTSRSEDQLQGQNDACDDDLATSLNTLLDTADTKMNDRIVWTYNAPTSSNGSTSSSPLLSDSPTSVSSSVLSSRWGGSSGAAPVATNGDYSVSEAISNMSSPDYRDEDSVMRDCVMECSDHSDSDSTLLVSERGERREQQHKIVIQVKGPGCDRGMEGGVWYQNSHEPIESIGEPDDEIIRDLPKSSSPHSSEDESDVDSLHSFHYSPKAVDLPSAIRLAKRLYGLDGFKKSDVSRHLSKNNDFSRAVAEEYLKYFEFEGDTLDIALRKFLKQFSLTGETQERERVLVHFSKRYLDCNPGCFNSQDAVHTLTCAIMLLNTDLHGQNINRKMTCNEFIDNLAGLNEQDNFPREVLKQLYHAIKNYPLEWALDEEVDEAAAPVQSKTNDQLGFSGNPFLDIPAATNAVEYKKGYVMRKCCYEANAKRTPFHKRSWKMLYCTLRDLVLYLHKDENGFKKNQMGDNLHNAIRIHHALATKAKDYTKKMFVFRLQTADQAEYLFQTGDSIELTSWIDTINFVCASLSATPLEAAVGSQKKFQRPLLPCSHTKFNMREQLRDHEERVLRLENELKEHCKTPPEKGSKSLILQNYREKETYLNYEVKRYRTYSSILRMRFNQYASEHTPNIHIVENSIHEADEASGTGGTTSPPSPILCPTIVAPPIPERTSMISSPTTNRCSLSVHITYYPKRDLTS